jgi:hypothetical protein
MMVPRAQDYSDRLSFFFQIGLPVRVPYLAAWSALNRPDHRRSRGGGSRCHRDRPLEKRESNRGWLEQRADLLALTRDAMAGIAL